MFSIKTTFLLLLVSSLLEGIQCFVAHSQIYRHKSMILFMSEKETEEETAVQQVTGEQLEMMMQEWEQPLLVDAFATWCGPCMQMAPEFEKAAEDMKGRVRFVKIDTDKEEVMAGRLGIQGLPTLLFMDESIPKGEDVPRATLKGRIEGALPQDMIVKLSEHFFFDGPMPEGLMST